MKAFLANTWAVTAMLAALTLAACGGPAKPAADAAKCAATEAFYTQTAGQVIDAGLCDDVAKVEECPPYRAIEEAYVTTMKEIQCPSARR